MYPFVNYAEEELIRDKVTLLKQQGHVGRSVKNVIGLDAPKTLKEKLAEKEQTTGVKVNVRSSQKSLHDCPDKVQQLGENTIEMAAIEKLVEEAE